MDYKGAFQTHQNCVYCQNIALEAILYSMLRYKTPFPNDWVQFYLAEVALAIVILHQNMVMYRDLKPENICIAADGHIKLVDFGLAKGLVQQSDRLKLQFRGD